MIDYRTLEKTIFNLEKDLFLFKQNDNKDLDDIFKKAIIQDFETCYEQSRKYITRFLKDKNIKIRKKNDADEEKGLFLEAKKLGLIDDASLWEKLNSARNNSSHFYDSEILDEIIAQAKVMLNETRKLLFKMLADIEVHINQDDLKNVLKAIKNVIGFKTAQIYIFGSRITNDYNEDSDLDIAVVCEKALTLEDRTYLDMEFSKYNFSFKIDIIDFNHTDPIFQENIKSNYKPYFLLSSVE